MGPGGWGRVGEVRASRAPSVRARAFKPPDGQRTNPALARKSTLGRHLLVAGSLRPNDDEFASLFADFVLETSGGADEPVDRRVFELVGGRLVEFAGVAAH